MCESDSSFTVKRLEQMFERCEFVSAESCQLTLQNTDAEYKVLTKHGCLTTPYKNSDPTWLFPTCELWNGTNWQVLQPRSDREKMLDFFFEADAKESDWNEPKAEVCIIQQDVLNEMCQS